ncbi:MAG: hemerythrin family protein [Synergistaceae bacterium]|jgi:hemerythrin-like metal-binding protein|nr:hemerythrin family protein [Synergistaceae bacterium]
MLWNKSLETGIALIDTQHKELFRQIDDLLDAGKGNRFGETLNFLEKYIVKHFTDEQKMHVTSKYPKAAKHKEYHDNYVTVFSKLKEKYAKEGPTLENRIAINKTVVGWLKSHILVHDREFAEYYKSL